MRRPLKRRPQRRSLKRRPQRRPLKRRPQLASTCPFLRPLLPPRLASICPRLMPPPRPRLRRALLSSLLAMRPALDLESLLSAPSTRVGLWHSRARSSLIMEQVPAFLCAGPLRSWSKSWHSHARWVGNAFTWDKRLSFCLACNAGCGYIFGSAQDA